MLEFYLFQCLCVVTWSIFEATFFHPIFTFFLNTVLSYNLYQIWEQGLMEKLLASTATSHHQISNTRMTYISTNVVKSNFLCALSPLCLYLLYDHNQCSAAYIQNLGAIYASLDCSALFYNRAMSWTTVMHHCVVIVFFFLNLMDDYQTISIGQMIMKYAIYSTFAYLVNFCLGVRFLHPIPRAMYFFTFCLYLFLCLFNWAEQFAFVRDYNDQWTVRMYILLLLFVVYDDIMLMSWLLQKAKSI